jgi:hypothetical protein
VCARVCVCVSECVCVCVCVCVCRVFGFTGPQIAKIRRKIGPANSSTDARDNNAALPKKRLAITSLLMN